MAEGTTEAVEGAEGNTVVEGVEGSSAAEAAFGTVASALPSEAALGKKEKRKGVPLSEARKAALKVGANKARTKKKAAKQTDKELWGEAIYPGETNGEGRQKEATDLDLKLLLDIQDKARTEKRLLAPAEMVKLLLELKATMPAKRERVNKNVPLATRKAIRTTLRRFNLNPSAARVKAFYNRGNYNTTYKRDKKINKNVKANTNLRNTLKAFFNEKGAKSPELVGLRKEKAKAKADLEDAKLKAEKDLKEIAKERRTKNGVLKAKTANPATVKHLAELRQGGYEIDAVDMVRLSSLVKQNKYAELIKDEKMKALIAEGKTMERACDRCLLTTIFGVAMK
jgi:hypothetical protein